MRIVPEHSQIIGSVAQEKARHLAARQDGFTAKLCGSTNWTITHIDKKEQLSDGMFTTLRDQIMSIKTKKDRAKNLFHSIDKQNWGSGGFQASFLQAHESEAWETWAVIGPLLCHAKDAIWVYKYMTRNAVARA